MSFPSLTIRTGSRLHFGPLSYQPENGRHFGGIGMMLDRPGLEITATATDSPRSGCVTSCRAESMLLALQSRHPELKRAIQIDVSEEIPAHSGLGSGTQLSLALMEILLGLHQRQASAIELARLSGRGDRSTIGIHGYEQGGFLVDAGHRKGAALGELACRTDVPPNWRILLLIPRDAEGLHGSVELNAFQQLGAMPDSISGRLSRLVLTEILPAVHQHQFEPFAAALYEYGQLVGEFFSATQGGRFASPLMRQLHDKLDDVAITGMAQSSWGPAVAMFAEHDASAAELRRWIESIIPASELRMEVTTPRNFGRSAIFN